MQCRYGFDELDRLDSVNGGTAPAFVPGGMPLAQVGNGDETQYLHGDQLGSVRLITDADGETIGTATYSAFGERTTSGASSTLGFAGEYEDTESGLVYLRARYYDPASGQVDIEPSGRGTHLPGGVAHSARRIGRNRRHAVGVWWCRRSRLNRRMFEHRTTFTNFP